MPRKRPRQAVTHPALDPALFVRVCGYMSYAESDGMEQAMRRMHRIPNDELYNGDGLQAHITTLVIIFVTYLAR